MSELSTIIIGIEKISRNDEEVESVGRHELSTIIGDPLLSKVPFFLRIILFLVSIKEKDELKDPCV